MGEKVTWQQGRDSDEEFPGEFKPSAKCFSHVVRHADGSETFYVNRSGESKKDPRIVIKHERGQ